MLFSYIFQVSNFIEEYTKLKNELQIVEKLKPYSLKNDDLISDLIKVQTYYSLFYYMKMQSSYLNDITLSYNGIINRNFFI